MVKVLIKKLDPTVKLPEYKTNGASGVDLTAFIKETIDLKPKKSVLVPTGLSVAFSEDFEIQIRPRSGLAAKNNISILNTPGTIDSDYRGEIKVIIYNHGNQNFLCYKFIKKLSSDDFGRNSNISAFTMERKCKNFLIWTYNYFAKIKDNKSTKYTKCIIIDILCNCSFNNC